MLKKTLAAVFLIASGPLSANELADLVNSSQAIRDTFKEGIKAVGGMWEYHSVGGIAQTGVVDPGMISDVKAQAYNNAVLAFKDATYTWSPDADSYMEDQAAQASQNLSEAIDDFVQASQAVITVVEVNEMAEEATEVTDEQEMEEEIKDDSTDYSSMKVAELKQLLKERELPVSGTKSELIKILQS